MLTAGVMTLKGVLQEARLRDRAPGAPTSAFVLLLDRPLCARAAAVKITGENAEGLEGRMLRLAFTAAAPRRFIGRRVLISGALAPDPKSPAEPQAVLQVGSLAPLPVVAAEVT